MTNHLTLEQDHNDLLFEAQNKLDDFTGHKITIIKAGCAKQDQYIGALRDCLDKHNEVLEMEQIVAERFQRMLPSVQLKEDLPRIVQQDDRVAQIAKAIHDARHPLMKRIA
jgi:DNA-directed RNA polymerase subunit H (RpoH/RPB5)